MINPHNAPLAPPPPGPNNQGFAPPQDPHQLANTISNKIETILQKATQIDQRCASELQAAADAAHQLSGIATGNPSGVSLIGLVQDESILSGVQGLWNQQINTIANLAKQAANGNAAAAAQLASYAQILKNDPAAATAVMTALGQQGIINLENTMGMNVVVNQNSPQMLQIQAELNSFLANGLASATKNTPPISPQNPDGKAGSPDALSVAWLQQLAGDANHTSTLYDGNGNSYGAVAGWWAIGEILNAPTATGYSNAALSTLAPPMLNWIKGNKNKPVGPMAQSGVNPTNDYLDPAVGLMTALGTNPQFTQAFLAQGKTPYENLQYLMDPSGNGHNWAAPGSDHGAALGVAVLNASQPPADMPNAAGQFPRTPANDLARQFITDYAQGLANPTHPYGALPDGNHLGSGANMSGLRFPAGIILSQHINQLNASLNTPSAGGAATFPSGSHGLGYVIEQVGISPKGFNALYQAQMHYIGQQINTSQPIETAPGELQPNVATAVQHLGYIAQTGGEGNQLVGTAKDLELQHATFQENKDIGIASQVAAAGVGTAASAIPGIGPVAGPAASLAVNLYGSAALQPIPGTATLQAAQISADHLLSTAPDGVQTVIDNTYPPPHPGDLDAIHNAMYSGIGAGKSDTAGDALHP